MYRDMPTAHVWPNCQAQEFDGDNFHRCEIGPPPGHVFHACECGHKWDDTHPTDPHTSHGNGGQA